MNDQPVEFNKMKESLDFPNIVRKSFRVPVENTQNVWVEIDKRRYPVLDICFDGIRIALEDKSDLSVQQFFSNCDLNIFDASFQELSGTVVHISQSEKKDWQCGIHWTNTHENTARQIFEIVSKMKKQLLKDDVISFDSP